MDDDRIRMTPVEELRLVFLRALKLGPHTDVRTLGRVTSSEWDSLGHLTLVVEIEEQFDVRFSVVDIAQIRDFQSAQEVLRRLGIEFDSAALDQPAPGSDDNGIPTFAVESEQS